MPTMSRAVAPCLITAEDLLRDPRRYKRGELWDGIFVVKDPSGGSAEIVDGRVAEPLLRFVRERDLGWVTLSNQGFYVGRDPDRVLSPDLAFTSYAKVPSAPRRGFFPCAPDFAVEVKSPEDSWTQVVEKCGVWIGHRVPVVWAVNPEDRIAVVFRPGQDPRIAVPGDEIDAAPALPEFRLRVAELFVRLG